MKNREIILDILADIIGSVFYAAGVNIFTTPNDIAPGGVTGIATMIHSVTGLQVGTIAFILNIPLVVMGIIILGKAVMLSTVRSLVILTAVMNITEHYMPVYTSNTLLSAIFGGLLIGIGLGVIFLRGSTTGGTDILGRILIKYFEHIPIGKILLFIDIAIVVAAGIFYGTMEHSLYALISIYVTERALDGVLDNYSEGCIALAVSDKYKEVTERVMVETDRGVTLLDGEGGYNGASKKVVLCAMPSRQFSKFKKLVFEVDPFAFVMTMPSKNIIGEGFKQTFE